MVDSQAVQHPWTRARFFLHGDGPFFIGYHKRDTWNGFAVPFFVKAEADKVAARVVDTGETYQAHSFNKREDEFVLVQHGVPCYAGEKTKGQDIIVNGFPLHVYGIGAGGWCWNKSPDLCEKCGITLDKDFTCSQCGVSHAGDACDVCDRHGYHEDNCDAPPSGHLEAGPKYVEKTKGEREIEERNLRETFERAYKYYNGWGFDYMHPGFFSYYQLGGDLRVFFTPDFNEEDAVGVQVQTDDGDALDEGGVHRFKIDRSAPALFRIVKPYLDRLAGKSAKDLKGGAR